ncbi:hypothetical protein EJ110_NYTH47121 [Nymphaea thermarum]|nr:hypothetical protein EJ110_NYTH47121 [Nymphaea thermarum]
MERPHQTLVTSVPISQNIVALPLLLSQNKRPELPGGPNQVASPPPMNLSTHSQLSSTSSAESKQKEKITYQLIMPARFFFLLFFSFTFSFSLSSAIRDRCRPEDAQILSEVFNRPIIDCCALSDTRCNANTSWIDYLTIKNDVISGRLSPAIGRMTRLQELILVRLPNVYGEIPSEMAKLTGLTNLVISDTNFTGPIPAWLGQLKNLK